MARIRRYPVLRHLTSTPTAHVVHVSRGRVVHSGVAQAFWFRPLRAAVSEVPVDDRELPMLFHARTADFQDVTVQGTVTYRFADPELAAGRVDFAVDLDTGTWAANPLEQVAGLITESAQQHALALVARTPLARALVDGVAGVRDEVALGLAGDARLAETGLVVLGVRVVAVRAEPDVEKALRTPARERVQQDADRATYERRALAVERERAIGENELQTRIELAHREELLVAQQGANARRQAEEGAAAARIETEGQAGRAVRLAEAKAETIRLEGDAGAAAEAARLAALGAVDPAVLRLLALRELAANLPHVETLVLTPDLLAPALARLASGRGGAAS